MFSNALAAGMLIFMFHNDEFGAQKNFGQA